MTRKTNVAVLFLSCAVCSSLKAQDGYFKNWFERSDHAKATQPGWMTPLATTTPRLEQEFRMDSFLQKTSSGDDLVNYGGGKGLEGIPFPRTQIVVSQPPYLQHNNPRVPDGFGDFSITGKYRLLSANESNGNHILTAFLGVSMPTGSAGNGAQAAIITPAISAGKGWRNFDVQTTLSAGLPLSHTGTIGRAIAFNTAFQYRVLQKLWPEVEINSTFWKGGNLDGKKQTFITPGIILGRFKVHGRVSMAIGAGFQIAVTQFHRYNHAGVFTIRFPF